MNAGAVTERRVTDLIARTAEAASAFTNEDMRRFVELVKHADDYTLMAPFGGETRYGFDALEAAARYFRGGEAVVEVVQSYVSGNLAVLVVIERQHGRIGGLPDQDLSLRVTQVFRREDSRWLQVHRHADPLVHPIGEDRLSALGRGDG